MKGQSEEKSGTENDVAAGIERGEVLYFPDAPFAIPSAEDRAFLATVQLGGKVHKNISYDPNSEKIGGLGLSNVEQRVRLRNVLAGFSAAATHWLAAMLPEYCKHWKLDRVSYRPMEEATRKLRRNARNDLLHVDAFPTRPTNGWRLLRVFANINFSEPRIWITSDPFSKLLERYGAEAGLPRKGFSLAGLMRHVRDFPRLFGSRGVGRSEYDVFMHRFHNYLKANEVFQEKAPRRVWTFPPGAVWVCMTDATSHAVLRGRHALEHSYFVAPGSLAVPDESPAALLARACGFPVLSRAA